MDYKYNQYKTVLNVIPQGLDFATHLIRNNKMGTHKHSHYEIIYILSGTTKHIKNGKIQDLSVGDCIILSPSDTHNYESPHDAINRDIMINENFINEILRIISPNSDEYLKKLTEIGEPVKFFVSELMELENIVRKFSNSNDIGKKRSLAIEITIKIFNRFFEKGENAVSDAKLIDKIMNMLNQSNCLQEGITHILKQLNYSKSYICHFVKKNTGISLSQHIKEKRLQYIEYYLKNTDYSLREIADMLGIESLSYLNKIFKEKYNMPPMAFRRKQSFTLNADGNTCSVKSI